MRVSACFLAASVLFVNCGNRASCSAVAFRAMAREKLFTSLLAGAGLEGPVGGLPAPVPRPICCASSEHGHVRKTIKHINKHINIDDRVKILPVYRNGSDPDAN